MEVDFMNNSQISPKLIPVKKIDAHIDALYVILKNRKFNISNNSLPSFNEHKLFVINNPYRYWYLIEVDNSFVGSMYLLKDNSIGLYVVDQNEDIIRKVIEWVLKNKKPLSEIKSVRSSNFHINVAPNNEKLSKIVEEMGAIPLQLTFSFKK
jgi:hypothetical protein